MAKVSVSEAARMAGISRSYLYRKYIKDGNISVERDEQGNPIIDTSEILRVFGRIQGDSSQDVDSLQTFAPEKDSKIEVMQTEIQLLREQLTAVLEDKKWLQGKVDQLTNQLDSTTRLLEHKPTPADSKAQPQPTKKRWWLFS